MTTYKWLRPDHRGAYGHGDYTAHLPHGTRPGKWLPAVAAPKPCARGYHVVDIAHLPAHWGIPGVLYEAETRGKTVEDGDKLACERSGSCAASAVDTGDRRHLCRRLRRARTGAVRGEVPRRRPSAARPSKRRGPASPTRRRRTEPPPGRRRGRLGRRRTPPGPPGPPSGRRLGRPGRRLRRRGRRGRRQRRRRRLGRRRPRLRRRATAAWAAGDAAWAAAGPPTSRQGRRLGRRARMAGSTPHRVAGGRAR